MSNQKKTDGTKKASKVDLSYWDQFNEGELNMLSLPPALKKYLGDNQLVGKFINASNLAKSQGFDHRGWQAFVVSDDVYDIISPNGLHFGKSPDGYVMRGDCVLAVMPKSLADKRKQVIAQRNKAYSDVNRLKAQELKDISGGGVRIHEGYDD